MGEPGAFRQWVSIKGSQTVVADNCPRKLRRALRKLIARQEAFDNIKDGTVKHSMTRPGSMNPRKR